MKTTGRKRIFRYNRQGRAAKTLLAFASLLLTAWLAVLWARPVDLPGLLNEREPAGGKGGELLWEPGSRASYSVIADKNVFIESRSGAVTVPPKAVKAGKAAAPVIIPPVQPPAPLMPPAPPPPQPPPPGKAPPVLTLLGTVILDGAEAAILNYRGAGSQAALHRVGDVIEGFEIKKIRKDMVVLEREGEVLTVVMNQTGASAGTGKGPVAPRSRGQTVTAPQSDIPLSLIPRGQRSQDGDQVSK